MYPNAAPPGRRPSTLHAASLAAIGLLFLLHALLYWPWVEDDAYISLRYAENLIAGHGPVFNPGERVEGYSNPAWVLLLATALRLGGDPLVVARVVGLLCGLGGLIVAWALARQLRPGAGSASLVAPAMLAASPLLARHAVSGLETGAYALCLALGVYVSGAGGPGRRRDGLAVSLAILLALLRPEGAVFGLLLVARRAGRREGGRLLWLCFGAAVALLLGWRLGYYGALLPNTFHFKMTGGTEALRSGFYYVREFLRDGGGVALVGFGLVPLLDRQASRTLRWIIGVVVLQVAVVVIAGGDWMHHYRFFAPVLPLLAAAVAAGVDLIRKSAAALGGRRHLPALIIAAMLGTALSNVYLSEREVWRTIMPAVRSGQYLSQSYARVGLWLREHTPPESVVAVSDVGAVGYYSGRRIVDMLGLVNSHIARTPGQLHRKHDVAYVLARRPDYVILVERTDRAGQPWYWRLADRAMAESPQFAAGYVLTHSIAMGFEDEVARIYRRRSTG